MAASRTHGTNVAETDDEDTDAQQAATVCRPAAVWWPATTRRHGTATVQWIRRSAAIWRPSHWPAAIWRAAKIWRPAASWWK